MDKIAQVIAQSSFDFWNDKEFRKLVDFDNISQTEQDRIFNELEVNTLGLFVLKYDHLEKDITESFLGLMKNIGIEGQFLKIWAKLIQLRLKEYREHYQLAIDQTKEFKELGEKELRIAWSRIETITIDCLTHIRRGDVKKEDLLWKMLRRNFTMLEIVFQKEIELNGQNLSAAKS